MDAQFRELERRIKETPEDERTQVMLAKEILRANRLLEMLGTLSPNMQTVLATRVVSKELLESLSEEIDAEAVAREIEVSDVASNIDMDSLAESVADNLRESDIIARIADNLSISDIASEIEMDPGEVAGALSIDKIIDGLDLDAIAERVADLIAERTE